MPAPKQNEKTKPKAQIKQSHETELKAHYFQRFLACSGNWQLFCCVRAHGYRWPSQTQVQPPKGSRCLSEVTVHQHPSKIQTAHAALRAERLPSHCPPGLLTPFRGFLPLQLLPNHLPSRLHPETDRACFDTLIWEQGYKKTGNSLLEHVGSYLENRGDCHSGPICSLKKSNQLIKPTKPQGR